MTHSHLLADHLDKGVDLGRLESESGVAEALKDVKEGAKALIPLVSLFDEIRKVVYSPGERLR